MFPSAITDFWLSPAPTSRLLYGDDAFSVTVDAALEEDERLTVLTTTDGRTRVPRAPDVAAAMALGEGQPVDEAGFRRRLEKSGIPLHGADNLFYFTDKDRETLLGEPDAPRSVRSPRPTRGHSSGSRKPRRNRISTTRTSNSAIGPFTARSTRGGWCAWRACTPGTTPRWPTSAC